MPRLPKQLVEERENFAREQFRKGLDLKAVNDKLAENYKGMKMAPPRLLELETEIKLEKVHNDLRGTVTVKASGTIKEESERIESLHLTTCQDEPQEPYAEPEEDAETEPAWIEPAEPPIRKPHEMTDFNDPAIQAIMADHVKAGGKPYGIFDFSKDNVQKYGNVEFGELPHTSPPYKDVVIIHDEGDEPEEDEES